MIQPIRPEDLPPPSPAITMWNGLSGREQVAIVSFVLGKITAITAMIFLFSGMKVLAKYLLIGGGTGIILAVVLALVELAIKRHQDRARLDREAVARLLKTGELEMLLDEFKKAKISVEDKKKKSDDDDGWFGT